MYAIISQEFRNYRSFNANILLLIRSSQVAKRIVKWVRYNVHFYTIEAVLYSLELAKNPNLILTVVFVNIDWFNSG